MAHVILLVVVIGALVALGRWVVLRRGRPEARLRRDFKRLRAMILSGMERGERAQARPLLDACGEHIERLLRAREQHRVLDTMASAAQELTDAPQAFEATREATRAFDREVAQSLSRFFADLSRIATVVGLRQEDPLQALRGFTEELEQQRDILLELSQELGAPRRGAPQHEEAAVEAVVHEAR